jgi:type IV pilus assembly protein PilX
MKTPPRQLSPTTLKAAQAQRGVVLIVSLILLAVISLLAAFSIRNATSSEAVSGNVRTTQLANQAAEIALRYCEDVVVQTFSPTPTFVVTPPPLPLAYRSPPYWSEKDGSGNLKNWDTSASISAGNAFQTVPTPQSTPAVTTTTAFTTVPTSVINGSVTYKRPPECMIESMQVQDASGALNNTSTYVVTARGFGPEVAPADGTRSRPQGSEVWLQSTIQIQ